LLARIAELEAQQAHMQRITQALLERRRCCFICHYELGAVHAVKMMPGCGHKFHDACIRDW
jgi:hypothetical protein